ncbi:MAG TPA: VWA domain-containing protein [Pyrinomonadaceae bacterium]|nr:VWA domain-containing protein [Pyrinomonadaceae bacterium]
MMFRTIKRVGLAALFAALVQTDAPSRAQQQPANLAEAKQDVIRVETNEVMIDVVARDKKGRPVRDIQPGEIEVYEDGVKQNVTAFQLIEADAAVASSSGARSETTIAGGTVREAPRPLNSLRQIKLVTLVFDTLGVESRRLAQQGALDFIKTQLPPNTYVAVFKVGNRLHVLQPFTNDRELLEKSVERATAASYPQYEDLSDRIRKSLEEQRQMGAAVGAAGSFAPPGTPGAVSSGAIKSGPPIMSGEGDVVVGKPDPVKLKLIEVTLNALRFTEDTQRASQGMSSMFSLLSLIRAQGELAGRKTVIYFAEGIQVPPSLNELFRTTISEANRAGVSVYGVDARGLDSNRAMRSSRDMLLAAVNASKSQLEKGSDVALSREEVMSTDTTESSLRKNEQGALEDLSTSTGGFLTANTNDLRKGMSRISSDLGSYYALSYTPPAQTYDGRFRQITVKLTRPGVAVQTRKGYFAVPPTTGPPLLPYEMPMLAALNRHAPGESFKYRVAALRFGASADGVRHQLLMEVPLKHFTFTPDAPKKVYRAQFSLMAVVRDAGGRIVERLGENFPLEGPLEKLETSKNRNVFFTRAVTLMPGQYTLETIAYDRATGKGSVRRRELMVAPVSKGVSLSSITVIKRVDPLAPERIAAGRLADEPLQYHGSKITPLMSEPVVGGGEGAGLPLYFVVYPADGDFGAEHPKLTLEFLRDGVRVGQVAPELPKAEKEGHIPYFVTVPAESFKPGRHEVKAVVKQGSSVAEERAFFEVANSSAAPSVSAAPSSTNSGKSPLTIAARVEVTPSSEARPTSDNISPPAAGGAGSVAGLMRKALSAPAVETLEAARLINEARRNGTRMHRGVLDYTYTLRKTRRTLDGRGKATDEEVQDFEAYPVRGQHVLVQLRENGSALSSFRVAAERKRVGRELEREEREMMKERSREASAGDDADFHIQAGIEGYSTKTTRITVDLSEFLRSCLFYAPRRERHANRETIALSFIPREDLDLPRNKSHVAKLVGTVWIDAADKVVTRLEGWPAVEFAARNERSPAPRREAAIIYQQMRLPTGVWLPSLIRMNAAGDDQLFNGLNWDVLFEMSDYKRFNTAVDKIEVDSSKEQQ